MVIDINRPYMNHTNLVDAIGQLAAEGGYEFHTADERFMSQTISAYPAMWLAPPQFDSMEGLHHGRMTYAVTLHALDEGAKLSPAERAEAYARLESDVVELFTSLSQADVVVAVEKLAVRAQSRSLTNHGEVAVTATADVITFF